MGSLQYDVHTLHFDDRLLAHLQIVIVRKLRKGDSFLMSWLNALSMGDGRSAVWLDHTIPLRFNFSGSRTPTINRDWLHALEQSADSSTGLIIIGEDGEPVRCNVAERP
jgi:hypothetical protein